MKKDKRKLCKDCELIEWKQYGGVLRPFSTNQSFLSYKKNGEAEMYAICPECHKSVKPNYKCYKK